MADAKVLIIDDELQIRKLLEITLRGNGFSVDSVGTGQEGIQHVASHSPDLVLLDLGLPDANGQDVLKHLREWYAKPIIIISVQSNESEIVRALENGANDYVVKPFRTGELIARVRSALRNTVAQDQRLLVDYGDLSIDFVARVVKKNGEVVKLTLTEYALLSLLIRNEGKVLTHQHMLTQIWGHHYHEQSQYLRVYIGQLRKKIEADHNRPQYIITESGVGYRFVAPHN